MPKDNPAGPDEPVVSAVIHGTRSRIQAAAAAAGSEPEFCIVGENGITFFMTSGFILLERVAEILNLRPEDLTPWEELSDYDRTAWGSLAAGNIRWAMDPEQLELYDVETLAESEPGLLDRLTAPPRRQGENSVRQE